MTTINRGNDNKENIAPDYRVFDLRGSHDEIGHQINSFNYLLADPTRFVAVEAHPSRLRAIEPDGDFLAVTNHYRHPDMVALQGRRNAAGSKRRVDRAQSWLAAAHSADAWEEVRLVLRDHTAPLCEHRPHNSTLWSVIADLGARRVAYAPGTPCRIAYQPVDWPSA
jgi:hypothetical protein